MPATEEITIRLGHEALAIARARVESGEFSSESEVITQALLESVLLPYEGASSEFLQECAQRYDRARKDPSTLLSLDDAFTGLSE